MVTTLPGLLLRTMTEAVGLTQSGSVFKSLAHVAVRVHVDTHSLIHTSWPCWCPRAVITASAREIWVPSAVSWGHGIIQTTTAAKTNVWVCGPDKFSLC